MKRIVCIAIFLASLIGANTKAADAYKAECWDECSWVYQPQTDEWIELNCRI